MDKAQERLLLETVTTTNNSLQLLTNAMVEMRADINTIYERQTSQLATWEQRWRRFMGDTPDPYASDDPPATVTHPDLKPWE